MLKKYLLDLIRFRTLSADHKTNRNALLWVREQLRQLPVYITAKSLNGFPSLVVTTRKTKSPKILLQAHMDVVDGSDKMFSPKISGTKVYGRGAFDMKFAIASYLAVFWQLGKGLPRYDLGIMLTSDEEVGGQNGVKKLLGQGYSAKVCVLPDGGENWTMQKSAKGTLQISAASIGVSGHGSRPWTGRNAISTLLPFLVELEGLFPVEPCDDDNHNHPTVNIGKISGGTETNKIPDSAIAQIDIRFPPSMPVQQMRGKIAALKKKYEDISIQDLSSSKAYEIPIHSPYIAAFKELVEKELGKRVKFIQSHGSSDARFFLQRDIPTILTRPVGGGHHSENEWVDIKSLEKFLIVLRGFIEKTAKL